LPATIPPHPLNLVRQVAQTHFGQDGSRERYAHWTRRLVLFHNKLYPRDVHGIAQRGIFHQPGSRDGHRLRADWSSRPQSGKDGEITILGPVLSVGGVQQKLRAALDARIKEVLILAENLRDAVGLPESVRDRLRIHPVPSIREALVRALPPMSG